jgi:hypothetical protein
MGDVEGAVGPAEGLLLLVDEHLLAVVPGLHLELVGAQRVDAERRAVEAARLHEPVEVVELLPGQQGGVLADRREDVEDRVARPGLREELLLDEHQFVAGREGESRHWLGLRRGPPLGVSGSR